MVATPVMVTPTSSRDKQWLQVPFHAGLSAQLNLGAEGSTYLRVDLRKGGTVPLKMGLCPNWTVERALTPSSWILGWRGMLSNRERFKGAN